MAATVAVIIPTYNRADLVTQAIDSVLNQTRVPDEIIVVDDGSTDDTWQRLQGYSSPVIAIRHDTNKGRSAARNTGILRSTADLLCFLDSDDLLTPRSIEVRANWLEVHREYGAAYGTAQEIDANGQPLSSKSPLATGENLFSKMVRYDILPISSFMFRRAYLPPFPYFDEDLTLAEDWLFELQLSASGVNFYPTDQTVTLIRIHSGMSRSPQKRFSKATLDVQGRIYAMDAFRTLPRSQQGRTYCSHAIQRIRSGYATEARQSLIACTQAVPWYIIAHILWLVSWLIPIAKSRVVARTQ